MKTNNNYYIENAVDPKYRLLELNMQRKVTIDFHQFNNTIYYISSDLFRSLKFSEHKSLYYNIYMIMYWKSKDDFIKPT